MAKRFHGIGPGAVVAAAFIGPGTVTTCTLAGAGFGYTLLWALTFSTIATLVLQEMAARVGLVTGGGLGEAVRNRFTTLAARIAAVGLVISAIAIGNAAYETGNLLGAALGFSAIVTADVRWAALAFAGIAGLLLWSGRYRTIERVLVAFVVLMSLVFIATAIAARPPLGSVLAGLSVPRVPNRDALFLAVGLIGTTVVPYNLFLHASAVRERWSGPEHLGAARADLGVAIVLGGVVSAAVVIAAAAGGTSTGITNAADMARQLEPVLGRGARILFGFGLFAAGLTSAITAPLAAAYATAGALGWPRDLRDRRLRAVWMLVLGTGAFFAAIGVRPVPAILFAQIANGVLLPAIAAFLLLAANDARMGEHRNRTSANALGVVVVLVTLGLGMWAVYRAVAAL